jgi:dTDP-4-amino-4,6-dideoxygalactose transaminase
MKVVIDSRTRLRYFALLEEVFDSGFLSEGGMVRRFEEAFGAFTAIPECIAVANCGLGLQAVLEGLDVRGREVVVPTNTFMATPLAARKAGAEVVYADCGREDFCLSLKDLARRITPRTAAVVLVHVGGHIAFQSEAIAAFLAERGIPLVEDCAHAHGATWNGMAAGGFGVAGVYSFYATKTMPLGEGGIVVSRDPQLAAWVRDWRNYGKFAYRVPGTNARMNEVTAALGVAQLERLPEILAWKQALAARYDAVFPERLRLPAGMVSGYYKYIVFDVPLREATGKVFDPLCHEIEGRPGDFPGAAWVREHHACPPIWYGWDGAALPQEGLRERVAGGA